MSAPTFDDGLKAARQWKRITEEDGKTTVRKVILYGSVARRDANENSDIDIAIVCEPFMRSKIKEVRYFYACNPDRDVRVNLVVIHPEELEDRYFTLVQEIKAEGQEV